MNIFKSALLFVIPLFSAVQTNAACTYEKVIQGEELEIGIMLNWSTEAEENNSMFIIEKSVDGVDFTDVGTVEGAGNSHEANEYSYLDVMARAEKNYYRLKQVDFDGSYLYSEILTMQKKRDNQFMVVRMSAITAFENFDVTINASNPGSLSYTLYDAQGDVIEDGNTNMLNGLNYINIDLVSKKPGIYKLQMQMGEEKETLVFKKVKDEDLSKQNFVSTRKVKE